MWMEESRSGVVRAPFTAASLALMPMSACLRCVAAIAH